jgi:hypothetical protein
MTLNFENGFSENKLQNLKEYKYFTTTKKINQID